MYHKRSGNPGGKAFLLLHGTGKCNLSFQYYMSVFITFLQYYSYTEKTFLNEEHFHIMNISCMLCKDPIQQYSQNEN